MSVICPFTLQCCTNLFLQEIIFYSAGLVFSWPGSMTLFYSIDLALLLLGSLPVFSTCCKYSISFGGQPRVNASHKHVVQTVCFLSFAFWLILLSSNFILLGGLHPLQWGCISRSSALDWEIPLLTPVVSFDQGEGGRCLRAASQGNKRYLQIKAKDKSTNGEKRNGRNTRTFMQKEKCEPFCISVWK